MMNVSENQANFSEILELDLAEVQQRFANELKSDLDCVNQLVQYVEGYRGKMLRPMLVLISAMATSARNGKPDRILDSHRTIAAVVEMVHMATLVHDDILDEADSRRQGETINFLHGNEAAVMLGDYLISHAYHLCSSVDDQSVSKAIASITNTVCEGELLQLWNRDKLDLNLETYYEILRRKTGALTGICTKMGAQLHGLDDAFVQKMYMIGEELGIAFQIIDDLLDLSGDQAVVGKTLGVDLKKGKLTLPLIHFLSTLDSDERQKVEAMIRQVEAGEDEVAGVLRNMMAEKGCLDYAYELASQRVDRVIQDIQDLLPQSQGKEMLLQIACAVIKRKS